MLGMNQRHCYVSAESSCGTDTSVMWVWYSWHATQMLCGGGVEPKRLRGVESRATVFEGNLYACARDCACYNMCIGVLVDGRAVVLHASLCACMLRHEHQLLGLNVARQQSRLDKYT